MALTPEMKALLTLHLVPGLGPRLTTALLERFGSAEAVLQAPADALAQVPHIGSKLARALAQATHDADPAQELELIERFHARLLAFDSPEYPPSLIHIPDVPRLLYLRGGFEERDQKAIALVGSRACTSYGIRAAERLARDLARAGYTIISGLARGIDAAAHRGALEAGGRTLAVLAGGLSRIYPPEHAGLAEEIEHHGGLLSEACMAMEPLAGMFPARNRIISGLSRGVIIVEAAEKSGALITARHAGEQARAVFAVPGPVDSAASGGTNKLIRTGAILVRGADDVLEELEGVKPKARPKATETPQGLDDQQQRIWDFLAEKSRHVDEIARQLGLGVGVLSRQLMLLEMKKIIRRLPGNMYERR